jgi:hypothetical protein
MPELLNYFVAFSDSRLKELAKRRENIHDQISAFDGQSKVQEYVNQIHWNTFSSLGSPKVSPRGQSSRETPKATIKYTEEKLSGFISFASTAK